MIFRHFILLLWLLCELISLAFSAPVPLAWDAVSSADSYRVWRGIEVLAVSASPSATVDLPDGDTSVIHVTARSAAGESDPSSPIIIYLPPLPKVTVQFSADLIHWSDLPFPAARFYRAKIETSNTP